jgi:hypothetical protein
MRVDVPPARHCSRADGTRRVDRRALMDIVPELCASAGVSTCASRLLAARHATVAKQGEMRIMGWACHIEMRHCWSFTSLIIRLPRLATPRHAG